MSDDTLGAQGRASRPDLVRVGAGVGVVLPASDCAWLAGWLQREMRRLRATDHVPVAPRVLRVLELLVTAAQTDPASVASWRNEEEAERRLLEPWLSTHEAAEALGLSTRRVQQLAAAGELAGAEQRGRDWLIPQGSVALLISRRTAS